MSPGSNTPPWLRTIQATLPLSGSSMRSCAVSRISPWLLHASSLISVLAVKLRPSGVTISGFALSIVSPVWFHVLILERAGSPGIDRAVRSASHGVGPAGGCSSTSTPVSTQLNCKHSSATGCACGFGQTAPIYPAEACLGLPITKPASTRAFDRVWRWLKDVLTVNTDAVVATDVLSPRRVRCVWPVALVEPLSVP